MTQIRPIPNRPWEQDPEVEGDAYLADEELPESAMKPLLGGPQAVMGAGRDDGQGLARVWQEAARRLKEHIFGHPDRAEAKAAGIGLQPTPAELGEAALAGGAAMMGGATAGGLAAHPLRAGLSLAGSFAGEKAGREAGQFAEGMGAPSGTATVGSVVGGVVGGGGTARRLFRSAGREAAEAAPLASEGPRTLHVPAGMRSLPEQRPSAASAGKVVQMPQAPTAAQGQAAEIIAKVTSLRSKGLSGAQIVSSIRQLFPGYRPSEYQKMVNEVIKASGARVR